MKVSVVTVCWNSAATIVDTLESVSAQSGVEVEHVVVDGGSSDATLQLVEPYLERLGAFVSEPDTGMYDAMNKGIALATGDIVAILNSDDVYSTDTALASVVRAFEAAPDASIVMGHVQFVRSLAEPRVVRTYRSARFRPWMMRFGWMPPHPATFIRRRVYEEHGLYKLDYWIAADYELLVRVLVMHRLSFVKVDEVLVTMRVGGRSTAGLRSSVTLNTEIVRACRENGLRTNLGLVLSKVPFKLMERIARQ